MNDRVRTTPGNAMNPRATRLPRWVVAGMGLFFLALALRTAGGEGKPSVDPKNDYAAVVQPLVKQYCLHCHSTKAKKGALDLERFASLEEVRKDLKPWQAMIEMLETGEMPPKDKPQPTAEERKRLVAWIRGFLDAE